MGGYYLSIPYKVKVVYRQWYSMTSGNTTPQLIQGLKQHQPIVISSVCPWPSHVGVTASIVATVIHSPKLFWWSWTYPSNDYGAPIRKSGSNIFLLWIIYVSSLILPCPFCGRLASKNVSGFLTSSFYLCGDTSPSQGGPNNSYFHNMCVRFGNPVPTVLLILLSLPRSCWDYL